MSDSNLVIETSTTTPVLPDGVVHASALPPIVEGGCTAYVHYNGPTGDLSTLCTGMAVLEPGATPHPPHRHPEEETMIVASGTGEIECDGKLTQVGPGDIMYCGSNVLHGITNTGATPMTFYFSKWIGKSAS